MRRLALPDEILMKVEKPARYIGGEYNSVMKDKDKVDVRFCMCFPDVYEIGMSRSRNSDTVRYVQQERGHMV